VCAVGSVGSPGHVKAAPEHAGVLAFGKETGADPQPTNPAALTMVKASREGKKPCSTETSSSSSPTSELLPVREGGLESAPGDGVSDDGCEAEGNGRDALGAAGLDRVGDAGDDPGLAEGSPAALSHLNMAHTTTTSSRSSSSSSSRRVKHLAMTRSSQRVQLGAGPQFGGVGPERGGVAAPLPALDRPDISGPDASSESLPQLASVQSWIGDEPPGGAGIGGGGGGEKFKRPAGVVIEHEPQVPPPIPALGLGRLLHGASDAAR